MKGLGTLQKNQTPKLVSKEYVPLRGQAAFQAERRLKSLPVVCARTTQI